jgi:flagellar basal body-associated protein FliL
MNKTVLFSNGPSTDDKNKTILIIVILLTIIFLSLILFLYIYITMKQNKKDSKKELNNVNAMVPLWRNAIIKNDIKLEDIYQKEINKNIIVNPIVENI